MSRFAETGRRPDRAKPLPSTSCAADQYVNPAAFSSLVPVVRAISLPVRRWKRLRI
jgi:hypothetical protein